MRAVIQIELVTKFCAALWTVYPFLSRNILCRFLYNNVPFIPHFPHDYTHHERITIRLQYFQCFLAIILRYQKILIQHIEKLFCSLYNFFAPHGRSAPHGGSHSAQAPVLPPRPGLCHLFLPSPRRNVDCTTFSYSFAPEHPSQTARTLAARPQSSRCVVPIGMVGIHADRHGHAIARVTGGGRCSSRSVRLVEDMGDACILEATDEGSAW